MTECQDIIENKFPVRGEPPCFKNEKFRSWCESSKFCVFYGTVGCQIFSKYRAPILLFGTILTILCLLFNIFALIGLSTSYGALKWFNWAYIDNSEGLLYIGINGYVYSMNDEEIFKAKWSETQCVGQICEDCKNAAMATISSSIIALITTIPKLTGNLQRGNRKGDLNCQKFMATVVGIIGCVSNFVAFQNFASTCKKSVDNTFQKGNYIQSYFGPSLKLMILATIFKAILVILHFLIPTPFQQQEQEKTQIQQENSQESTKQPILPKDLHSLNF